MAEKFTNTANAMGDVLNVATGLTAAVTVQLVNGLTMTKTATPMSWADGELTFTLQINNTSDDTYTGVVINDLLAPTIMALVPDSVTLNDTPTTNYNYNESSGELVLFQDEPIDVAANDSITVTFRVIKA